jgi:predicted alpha-1,2-mannosidase
MTPRLSRRKFGALTAAAIPSFWVAGNWRLSGSEGPEGPASFINPLIGASTNQTLGEGKTFPGPATPFGMVQLGPDTITAGDNAPGYSFEHKTIEGFSFTRMSGVGWYGDFGNLQIMPTVGPMKLACGRVDRPGEGWRSRFRHETELARVNYYSVTLDDSGIRAELTAAPRGGMLLFTFPKSGQSRIQIDLARRIGGTSLRQFVKVVNEHVIEAWMKCPSSGGGWGNGEGNVDYTVYFHTEFSKPLERFGVWKIDVPDTAFPVRHGLVTNYFQSDAYYDLVRRGQVLDRCVEQEGNHVGFFLEFPTHAGEQVTVKSGISFVGVEGARNNLAHDIPAWNFADVRRRGVSLWNAVLGAVEIEGASDTQKVIFSTALYHAMLDPRLVSDVDGRYRAADKAIRTTEKYSSRTIFSGWEVFRAQFPLLTLLNPTS